MPGPGRDRQLSSFTTPEGSAVGGGRYDSILVQVPPAAGIDPSTKGSRFVITCLRCEKEVLTSDSIWHVGDGETRAVCTRCVIEVVCAAPPAMPVDDPPKELLKSDTSGVPPGT